MIDCLCITGKDESGQVQAARRIEKGGGPRGGGSKLRGGRT